MKKSRRPVCLGIAAALLLTACGGGHTGGPPTGPSGSTSWYDVSQPDGQDPPWYDDSDPFWQEDTSSPDAQAQGGQDLSQLDTADYSGSFSSYTTLTDPATGIPVMDVLMPYGWTAQVQCDWSFVSTNNPCIASVQFTSPDQQAAVLIHTSQDYLESYDNTGLFPHQDYTDMETYIVHLAYKNAGQVLDMYFNGVLGTGGTVVSETPVPAEFQSFLDQTAQTFLNTVVDGINQIGGGYGVTAQASSCEGTISMRRYRFTSGGQSYMADAATLCVAAQYISPSYGINFVNTMWVVPGIMVCVAPDEATLDRYSVEYEMICSNMVIRNEFNYAKQAYGNYIRGMVMQQQANSIAAMTEAQAQAYMNDYDSSVSSGDSSYTSDDWANDWSDYIYDRNEYTTADGSTIKVGTEVDSVFQNGDEFYFGSKADAPLGWEQLIPN